MAYRVISHVRPCKTHRPSQPRTKRFNTIYWGAHDYAQHVSAQRQKLPFSHFSSADCRERRSATLSPVL